MPVGSACPVGAPQLEVRPGSSARVLMRFPAPQQGSAHPWGRSGSSPVGRTWPAPSSRQPPPLATSSLIRPWPRKPSGVRTCVHRGFLTGRAGHCSHLGGPAPPRGPGCSACHSPGRNREQPKVPHSRVFCLAGSHTWCRIHHPAKGGWESQPGARPGDLPEVVIGPSPLSQPAVPRAHPWKPWRPV